MKFGSVCSGIEAASVAWEPLGWKASWFSEIEPFPSAVLAHHYPHVPNHGDMTLLPQKVLDFEVDAPDILCGGTPCQAFSVAGLRRSLDDARGNLSLTFCELANAIDTVRAVWKLPPAIIFWENVPGVLSTKDNAFGCFLAGLAGEDLPLEPPGGKWTDAGVVLGPARAVAWRTLDAQFFALAQRRKRVFVVSSARDGFDPVEVLLEFDGVRRDSPPSRQARKGTAGGVAAGFDERGIQHTVGTLCADTHPGAYSGQDAYTGKLVPQPVAIQGTLIGRGENAGPQGSGADVSGAMFTLTKTDVHAVAFAQNTRDEVRLINGDGQIVGALAAEPGMKQTSYVAFGVGEQPDVGHCLRSGASKADKHESTTYVAQAPIGLDEEQNARVDGFGTLKARMEGGGFEGTVMTPAMQVRRLTPTECERLQGFPDGYTAIPWKKKPASECPDGPRYKALGNSWAVPNVRWIGRRIDKELQ